MANLTKEEIFNQVLVTYDEGGKNEAIKKLNEIGNSQTPKLTFWERLVFTDNLEEEIAGRL